MFSMIFPFRFAIVLFSLFIFSFSLLSNPIGASTCNTTIPPNAPSSVNVGFLAPASPFFLLVIQFSFEQLNADDCLLPGTTVVPIINITGLTDLVSVFEQFLYQAEVQHVAAVVGPLTGDACRVTAVTSPLYQIPQV
jgi:hypothetical protein